jgi:asparagine synthase (glutamine-hydrolysing)
MKLGNLGEVVRLNENEFREKQAVYFEKTRDGKLILRKLMERYIPTEVTQRAKQGFSAPDASWFRGESIDYVRRELLNGHRPMYEFLDRGAVHELINEHIEGKQNRRLLTWSLLNFDQFCQRFLD